MGEQLQGQPKRCLTSPLLTEKKKLLNKRERGRVVDGKGGIQGREQHTHTHAGAHKGLSARSTQVIDKRDHSPYVGDLF